MTSAEISMTLLEYVDNPSETSNNSYLTTRVQSLVRFIRKRDPRYKAHIARQQNATMDVSIPADSALPVRKAHIQSTYVDQEWQKVDRPTKDEDLEWAIAEDGNLEEWECVACGKSFRSEAAWDSHERSKKHMKELERLKREMGLEEDELGLAEGIGDLELDEPTVQPAQTRSLVENTNDGAFRQADALGPSEGNQIADAPSDAQDQRPRDKHRQSRMEGDTQSVPLTKSEKKLRDLHVDPSKLADKPDDRPETTNQASTSVTPAPDDARKGSKHDKRKGRESKKTGQEGSAVSHVSHLVNRCEPQ